jgi:hypothetical protein
MKFVIVALFQLLVVGLYAQDKSEDIVTTKDGGVYRGSVLEVYPDSILKIRAEDKTVYVLPMKEVKKISRRIFLIPRLIHIAFARAIQA